MSYLRYLCLFAYIAVEQILCCISCFVFLLLMYPMLSFLWIVHFVLPLRYSLTFICLVSCVPYVVISLDCPFCIAPSVFSNVYLSCVLCTLCCHFSGLSIWYCPFGIL